MSDLDDLLGDGLEALGDVAGLTEFRIDRHRLYGIYNSFSGEREFGTDGPPIGTYPATILAPLDQFTGRFPAPLERTLPGRLVQIEGRKLRIDVAVVDTNSITLTLENANASK